MEVNKSESINNIIKVFRSGRDDIILQALKNLRDSGNDEVLPEILTLLEISDHEEIHREVIRIMNDLKNQSSVEVLMDNISGYRNNFFFPELISACWQNGLDFSGFMDFFIEIALQEDYNCSFEAFTVVERNVTSLSNKDRENLSKMISEQLPGVPAEKKTLVRALFDIVYPFSGPFRVDNS